MPIAVWPSTLPQKPLVEGYQEQAPSIAVRTQMDAGPPKVRRRYTAGIRLFTLGVDLTKAQVELLDAFFLTTLLGGVERFEWQHPRTGTTKEFRFVSPPSYAPMNGEDDIWMAQLQVEIMP